MASGAALNYSFALNLTAAGQAPQYQAGLLLTAAGAALTVAQYSDLRINQGTIRVVQFVPGQV